jgi:hypothetical protein
MSRYQVDKLLREVIMNDDALAAWIADPRAFLAGRDITDEEREALIAGDYPTLYKAGVHPFMLNVFAVRQWPPNEMIPRWVAYSKALEGAGYPDFST